MKSISACGGHRTWLLRITNEQNVRQQNTMLNPLSAEIFNDLKPLHNALANLIQKNSNMETFIRVSQWKSFPQCRFLYTEKNCIVRSSTKHLTNTHFMDVTYGGSIPCRTQFSTANKNEKEVFDKSGQSFLWCLKQTCVMNITVMFIGHCLTASDFLSSQFATQDISVEFSILLVRQRQRREVIAHTTIWKSRLLPQSMLQHCPWSGTITLPCEILITTRYLIQVDHLCTRHKRMSVTSYEIQQQVFKIICCKRIAELFLNMRQCFLFPICQLTSDHHGPKMFVFSEITRGVRNWWRYQLLSQLWHSTKWFVEASWTF